MLTQLIISVVESGDSGQSNNGGELAIVVGLLFLSHGGEDGGGTSGVSNNADGVGPVGVVVGDVIGSSGDIVVTDLDETHAIPEGLIGGGQRGVHGGNDAGHTVIEEPDIIAFIKKLPGDGVTTVVDPSNTILGSTVDEEHSRCVIVGTVSSGGNSPELKVVAISSNDTLVSNKSISGVSGNISEDICVGVTWNELIGKSTRLTGIGVGVVSDVTLVFTETLRIIMLESMPDVGETARLRVLAREDIVPQSVVLFLYFFLYYNFLIVTESLFLSEDSTQEGSSKTNTHVYDF